MAQAAGVLPSQGTAGGQRSFMCQFVICSVLAPVGNGSGEVSYLVEDCVYRAPKVHAGEIRRLILMFRSLIMYIRIQNRHYQFFQFFQLRQILHLLTRKPNSRYLARRCAVSQSSLPSAARRHWLAGLRLRVGGIHGPEKAVHMNLDNQIVSDATLRSRTRKFGEGRWDGCHPAEVQSKAIIRTLAVGWFPAVARFGEDRQELLAAAAQELFSDALPHTPAGQHRANRQCIMSAATSAPRPAGISTSC